MKKIGIFGGTFDPIHHGHLVLAREALETLALDLVVFIPAAASPHKPDSEFAGPALRLEMVRAAIEGEPRFAFEAMELERPSPSYAIDTVEALQKREPDAEFFYLIGEDNVARLNTWHRFTELEKLVQFIVLDRTGRQGAYPYPVIRRHLDISATEIRNRIATERSIRYLVPPAVEKIIHGRQLYREPEK